MARSDQNNPSHTDASGNDDKLEKIRWSMQQRLCEYMRLLLADLFDEVDDFLFAKAPPGQISGEGSHLRVIREFRNKKQFFEEKFLDIIDASLQSTLIPRQRVVAVGNSNAGDDSAESSYEKMEIDLAFERMQRKAFKHYSEQIKQLKTPPDESGKGSGNGQVIPEHRDLLIGHTVRALADSHEVFRVSLDNRLVFFKLFEKHLLLNLERLYQDIIKIINNKDNEKFVERLYSSSTSISKRRSRDNNASVIKSGPQDQAMVFKSRDVEIKVDEIVSGWCEERELAEFVVKMLHNDWHNVLFLIGLNKGIDTREWQKAVSSVERLIGLLESGSATESTSEKEVDALKDQLRQGFELAQKPLAEQRAFFHRLDQALSSPGSGSKRDETTSIIEAGSHHNRPARTTSSSYASVSEAGRRLFNSDDLDDFVALLSDDRALAVAEVDEEAISMDYYLNMVENMADGIKAELAGYDKSGECRIQKSTSVENSYQVIDAAGRVLLTRSRVGLAVSLRAGEIRLEDQEDFKTSSSTAERGFSELTPASDKATTH